MPDDLLSQIREAVTRGDYAFTLHAVHQAEERSITPGELEDAILDERSEILENYFDDPRGPSCLVLGWTGKVRPLHAQVTYPPFVLVITIYEPTEDKWLDQRIRRN